MGEGEYMCLLKIRQTKLPLNAWAYILVFAHFASLRPCTFALKFH